MSRVEAIELFNKGDLVKSEKYFLAVLSSTQDEREKNLCLEYLVGIQKKLQLPRLREFKEKLISSYFQLKNYEKVIEHYEDLSNKTLDLKILYTQSLWEGKDFNKFDREAQNLCEEILINKYYNKAYEYFVWLKEKRSQHLYPYFSSIIFQLEIADYQALKIELMKIDQLLSMRWKKIQNKKKSLKDYYLHLLKILKTYDINEFEIKKMQKKIELKNHILSTPIEKIEVNAFIEYLILFHQNYQDLSLLLPLVSSDDTQADLIEILQTQKNKIVYPKDSPFGFLRKYLIKKKKITKPTMIKEYYPRHYHLENLIDEVDESIFDKYLSSDDDDSLEQARKSFRLLAQLNSQDLQDDNGGLIVALMELGLFDSAELLTKQKEEDLECQYLKVEILYKKNEYLNAIILTNEILEKFNLEDDEKISFFYMKACCYLKLNKKNEAQNIFSLIATFNPKFRRVQERLLND